MQLHFFLKSGVCVLASQQANCFQYVQVTPSHSAPAAHKHPERLSVGDGFLDVQFRRFSIYETKHGKPHNQTHDLHVI
jgi:hypothetical protein